MSEDMKSLLRHCLKESPIRRPHDFVKIEEDLLRQYEAATGRAYSRPKPQASISGISLDIGKNKATTVFAMGERESGEEKSQKKRGRPPKKTAEENLPQPAKGFFDPAWYSDPANMTKQRSAAIEDLCAEMDEDFERGDLSREEMLVLVKESYDKPPWAFERYSLRELYGLYKPIELLAIDDEGDYHDLDELKGYTVNGKPFCCWHPMDEIKKGVFKCRFCGSSCKESNAPSVPKKRGRPKKSENNEKTVEVTR
jgi:hypothetical protein